MSHIGEPVISLLLDRDTYMAGGTAAERESAIRQKFHLETMRSAYDWYKSQEGQERRFRNKLAATGSAAGANLTEAQTLRRSVFSTNKSVTGDGIRDSSAPGETVVHDLDCDSDSDSAHAKGKGRAGSGKAKGGSGSGKSKRRDKASSSSEQRPSERGAGAVDERGLGGDGDSGYGDSGYAEEDFDDDFDVVETEQAISTSASTNHASPRAAGGARGAAGARGGGAAAPTGHRRRTAAVNKNNLSGILTAQKQDQEFKVKLQAAQHRALEALANRGASGASPPLPGQPLHPGMEPAVAVTEEAGTMAGGGAAAAVAAARGLRWPPRRRSRRRTGGAEP